MSIDYTDAEGVRHIQVSGRLDIPGAAAIDVPLTALAASQPMRVILDLEAVEFLSSIGIRQVVSNAKAQRQRGGKLVVHVGGNTQVRDTLVSTGIHQLVPVCETLDAARAAALA